MNNSALRFLSSAAIRLINVSKTTLEIIISILNVVHIPHTISIPV